MLGNKFGEAGSRVVVEEFLQDEEASFIVMVDGENVLPMATSHITKPVIMATMAQHRRYGCLFTSARDDEAIHDWVMTHVIYPTVKGMAQEGNIYTGFLYAGLMIDAQGKAKVLEITAALVIQKPNRS